MTEMPPTDRPLPWAGLVAAISAIAVAAMAFGHSLPLFSILLKTYGASDATIGFNTAATALGAIIATPFYPRIMKHLGIRMFLLGCVATLFLMYGGIYLAGDNIALWYPLRLIFGFAGAGLFAGSEIWINALAPNHLRGRILGIYGTALAGGFALGPLLLEPSFFGYEGFTPFLAGMSIFALAAIPIALGQTPPADAADSASGFFPLLLKAPAIFWAAAVFAGLEAAVLIFLPVLAIDRGWAPEVGARAVTVYGLGIVALQYAIGHYADRFGPMRMLTGCATAATAMGLTFALIGGSLWALYTVLFIWGGFIAGLYTLGLTLIGERFDERSRVAANTGYVFMYGIGAILGPVAAGLVREFTGPDGLNLLLLGTLAAYTLLVWTRRRKPLP